MYKTIVTERIFIAVKFNKHKFLLTFPISFVHLYQLFFLHAQIHTHIKLLCMKNERKKGSEIFRVGKRKFAQVFLTQFLWLM